MSIGRGGYECYIYQTQVFKNQERKKLLPYRNNFEEPNSFKHGLMENYRGDFINKMAITDYYTILQQILVKVDRASMMNSLEVRTPFLNKELIEFSFKHIGGDLKLKEMLNFNFLNEKFVTDLINLQEKGRRNLWNKLFAIYIFKRWYNKWVK